MSTISVWHQKVTKARGDIKEIANALQMVGHPDPDHPTVAKDVRISTKVLLETYLTTKKKLSEMLEQPLAKPVPSPDDHGQLCTVFHADNAIQRLNDRIVDLCDALQKAGFSISGLFELNKANVDDYYKKADGVVRQVLLATLG